MADYNIYCDESCHLEHDAQRVMVLGAVTCPANRARETAKRLREIKARHGYKPEFELKWTKVSPANLDFYKEIVNYHFDCEDLSFRAVVIPKKGLRHSDFAQTHDDFYYKCYFLLLKLLLEPKSSYRIFVDIKDTQGSKKIAHLRHVLHNNAYDYDQNIIRSIQHVRSHHVQHVQLADVLMGAIGYAHRGLRTSSAKLAIVNLVRQRSGYGLDRNTLMRERKLNLFIWTATEARDV